MRLCGRVSGVIRTGRLVGDLQLYSPTINSNRFLISTLGRLVLLGCRLNVLMSTANGHVHGTSCRLTVRGSRLVIASARNGLFTCGPLGTRDHHVRRALFGRGHRVVRGYLFNISVGPGSIGVYHLQL